MLKKNKTLQVTKIVKKVAVKGGTSKQHAKAGKLGGLAPHVCRGRECTKIKEEAALKLAAKAEKAAKAVKLQKSAKIEPTKRTGVKKLAAPTIVVKKKVAKIPANKARITKK